MNPKPINFELENPPDTPSNTPTASPAGTPKCLNSVVVSSNSTSAEVVEWLNCNR